jgi:hypothetical protein
MVLAGVVQVNCEGAAAPTVMELEVTENDPPLAVMVFDPAVFKVMLKDPTPFTRVEDAGRVAAESVDVKETDPAKVVAVFP